MKSKKLFAILTLVAFLMTLIPIAAFGYTTAASTVTASNTSPGIYVAGDKSTAAKVTITFKDDAGDAIANTYMDFYVKSSRDAEQGWVDFSGTTGVKDGIDIQLDSADMGSDAGQAIHAQTNADGKVYVYVGSAITGSFTFKVFNADSADGGLQIGDNVVVKISAGDGDFADFYLADEDGGAITGPFKAGQDFDITAVLKDGSNAIEGKTVTFKKAFDNGSYAVLGTAVTDEDGEATFYYKVTKAGTYDFKVVAGDADDEMTGIVVDADDASTIVAKTADGKKIATDEEASIEFEIQDDYGNVCKDGAAEVNFDVTAAPADSDYVDYSEDLVATDADGVATLKITPDKVGKYTIKAKIDGTRTSKSIEVEAVEFDAATSLAFTLKDSAKDETIPAIYFTDDHSADGYLKVEKVNKDGVAITVADPAADLKFATADNSVLSVDEEGYLEVVDDEFAGTVNVTVSYADDGVVGTFAVPIAGKPAAIKATPVVDGKTAAVTLQLVDKTGKDTNSFDLADTYEVILPSGVSTSSVEDFDVDGQATFDLAAENFGKYSVTVMSDLGISKTFTVDFAAPVVVPPVIGAKTVTMFIGATGYVQDGVAKVTDVAPFIKDGRTFVAVRAIADAFGATATWNEATQTVTLTRSDRTITIVIGSPTITVVKDGVTSTVTADVPAFIVNGRTVLPFRAVAEAFGATVAYDAATGAVTFNQ